MNDDDLNDLKRRVEKLEEAQKYHLVEADYDRLFDEAQRVAGERDRLQFALNKLVTYIRETPTISKMGHRGRYYRPTIDESWLDGLMERATDAS